MFTFQFVAWVSGGVAALCVAAFPLWIMGVPGQADSPIPYVRGWKMGMGIITAYPLAWALNFLPYFALHGLVSRKAQLIWRSASGWIGAIALAAALIRLTRAFWVLNKRN